MMMMMMLMLLRVIASLIEMLIIIVRILRIMIIIITIPVSGSDVPSNSDNNDDDDISDNINVYQHPVLEMKRYKIHKYWFRLVLYDNLKMIIMVMRNIKLVMTLMTCNSIIYHRIVACI